MPSRSGYLQCSFYMVLPPDLKKINEYPDCRVRASGANGGTGGSEETVITSIPGGATWAVSGHLKLSIS